jgi:hypothetical protein
LHSEAAVDDSQAKQITDALEREPGLIVVTCRVGGGEVEIFGRSNLRLLGSTFGTELGACELATLQAINMALRHRIALVFHFDTTGLE